MSKLYEVLRTVIDKVNCSIKAEPQTLTDEQKAQARVNIGAEASGTAESFAKLAAASAESAQKNAGFAAASETQAAGFAASASASQTAAANSAAAAASAADEAKGYRDEAKEMLDNAEIEPVNTVLFTKQALTDVQKAQARSNIGAISDSDLAEELVKIEQATPEFVDSIEECTDPSKMYVLPDGYIYAYMTKQEEVVVPGETVTIPAKAAILVGKRYSLSGGAFKDNANTSAVILPLPKKITGNIQITLVNMTKNTAFASVYGGTVNDVFTETVYSLPSAGTTEFTFQNTDYAADNYKAVSNFKFVTFFVNSTGASGQYASSQILMNGVEIPFEVTTDPTIATQESITTTEGSAEIIKTEGFVSTGHAFIPADYEDRIITLERTVNTLAENKKVAADESMVVHNAVGTIYPPSQKPASSAFEDYDIDIYASKAADVQAYIDTIVKDKVTVTKEILGKDGSGQYEIARYIYAQREHIAWQRVNYPPMYAWKNDQTVIYSVSVSPRIEDIMYSTPYIGTAYATVTAVNATNRSRIVNNLEFVRYESKDIKPTVIYTDCSDNQSNNTSIEKDGIVYTRYPLGDLGANRKKLTPITIWANVHGVPKSLNDANVETKMCALVAARFLRDLASNKQTKNPFYQYIRENCMVVIIPIANPYGFNYNLTSDENGYGGYYTVTHANINRNYDTPGWDTLTSSTDLFTRGAYPGSEIETQYIMNTMVESGAVVAMSLHGVDGFEGYCLHQGQNPSSDRTGYVDYSQEKLSKIERFLKSNWGYTLRYYDMENGEPIRVNNTPDVTSKDPSFISQCGAYGGIVEFQPDDPAVTGYAHEMKANVIENAYAQMLNLMAMWLSDYLESYDEVKSKLTP